jgi:protein FLOWERING LOCUS T
MERGDPLMVGRVIGDVVDPFVRRVPLRVAYASRVVSNCCELRPSAVADQPRVEVGGPDMRTFYTLVKYTVYLSSWTSIVCVCVCASSNPLPYTE